VHQHVAAKGHARLCRQRKGHARGRGAGRCSPAGARVRRARNGYRGEAAAARALLLLSAAARTRRMPSGPCRGERRTEKTKGAARYAGSKRRRGVVRLPGGRGVRGGPGAAPRPPHPLRRTM